jgi:hypothetical protein
MEPEPFTVNLFYLLPFFFFSTIRNRLDGTSLQTAVLPHDSHFPKLFAILSGHSFFLAHDSQ